MSEPLPELDRQLLPRHVAIIMDGNSRWARGRGLTRAHGHDAGGKSVRAIVEACRELGGIEAVSLYAFSTENWRRSKTEVNTLFRLLSKYIHLEIEAIHKQNIRVTWMGSAEGLPERAVNDLRLCLERTAKNTAMTMNLAINYGGRREIADAARAIATEVKSGSLKLEAIDEACVARHLYCPDLPDPDLLIRTSGEMRISNFMLWQLSYSEIVTVPTLWPDFRKPHLYAALAEYQARSRRYGGR
ncbi:MAG: isoprenyl transferase [Candidatus Hydrogenedentota bacterium]